jgi:serralysin
VQTFGPIGSTAGTQAFYQSNAEFYIRAYFGVSGIFANAHDNLAIAYGTVIENAIGGTKRDLLLGNDAANVLKGNGGDDVLDGLAGPDTYYGGAGNDTFVVSTLDVGDAIADFVSSEDTVDLTAFGGLSFIGGAAFSGVAGELSYDGASLSADLDGDGAADWSMSVGAGLTAANLAL